MSQTELLRASGLAAAVYVWRQPGWSEAACCPTAPASVRAPERSAPALHLRATVALLGWLSQGLGRPLKALPAAASAPKRPRKATKSERMSTPANADATTRMPLSFGGRHNPTTPVRSTNRRAPRDFRRRSSRPPCTPRRRGPCFVRRLPPSCRVAYDVVKKCAYSLRCPSEAAFGRAPFAAAESAAKLIARRDKIASPRRGRQRCSA